MSVRQNVKDKMESDLMSLKQSDQYQQHQIKSIMNVFGLLQNKLIHYQSHVYCPNKILLVVNDTSFNHLLEFLPLKQQLSLRLVCSRINQSVSRFHVDFKALQYKVVARLLQEDLTLMRDNLIHEPAYLADYNHILNVEHLNNTLLQGIEQQHLINLKADSSRNRVLTTLLIILLDLPHLNLKLYSGIFYKDKITLLRLIHKINIFQHPRIVEIQQLLIRNAHEFQLVGTGQRPIFDCLANIVNLRTQVVNQQYFFDLKRMEIKIMKQEDNYRLLQSIYKTFLVADQWDETSKVYQQADTEMLMDILTEEEQAEALLIQNIQQQEEW